MMKVSAHTVVKTFPLIKFLARHTYVYHMKSDTYRENPRGGNFLIFADREQKKKRAQSLYCNVNTFFIRLDEFETYQRRLCGKISVQYNFLVFIDM